MVDLLLTFVLRTDGAPPRFDRATVPYASMAQCVRARDWWLAHPDGVDAQGIPSGLLAASMAPPANLLIGPSCRPHDPVIS